MATIRKLRAKGSGSLQRHGRTYRAIYFKLDPRAASGFVRVTEGTGISADGTDPEDRDPLTGNADPKRARARAELWLEGRSAPYRQFIQHGRFVADAAKLAKVARDAQAKTEGKVAEAARDLAAAEDKLPALTLEAAWVAFDKDNASKNASDRREVGTHRNYCQWYHLLTDWVEANRPEATELRDITPEIAESYAVHLRSRVRATTYNRHLNALALIWATLLSRRADGSARFPEARLGVNPFAWDKHTQTGIERIKLEKRNRSHSRRDLTLEECAKLLKAAEGEMRVLLALGLYTGLREGDCVTLKVANIDRVFGTISARSNKTDTLTETAIHPALARIMAEGVTATSGYILPELADLYTRDTFAAEIRSASEEELAALELKGAALAEEKARRERVLEEKLATARITGRVELTRRIAAVFNKCGIETSYREEGGGRARPETGFHALRHTFATLLERARVAAEDRRRLMGHATQQMTAHYTHSEAGAALALPDLSGGTAHITHATGNRSASAGAGAIAYTGGGDALAAACAAADALAPAELRKLKKYITEKLGKREEVLA